MEFGPFVHQMQCKKNFACEAHQERVSLIKRNTDMKVCERVETRSLNDIYITFRQILHALVHLE